MTKSVQRSMGRGVRIIRKRRNNSLQEVAEQMLTRRVRKDRLGTSKEAMEELNVQFCTGRNGNTVTVAQAIVLAIGRRALDGDKSAAEYLQRLADQAAEKRTEEDRETQRNLVIRVKMVDDEVEDRHETAERNAGQHND